MALPGDLARAVADAMVQNPRTLDVAAVGPFANAQPTVQTGKNPTS
jgi:hypothetical protein